MTSGKDVEAPALIEILDRVADKVEGEKVSLGDLFGAFGRRAFGPMLLIPAFIAVAPTGAIPGMSIATGSLIILIAGQMLLPVEGPWLPRCILDIGFSRSLFDKSVDKARPHVERISRIIKPRWPSLARPPWTYAVAVVCIVMACLMFPLAFLPFAVVAPGMVIILLAVGITVRDGLVVAIGLLGAVTTGALAYQTAL